jgi:hypothetical protein
MGQFLGVFRSGNWVRNRNIYSVAERRENEIERWVKDISVRV